MEEGKAEKTARRQKRNKYTRETTRNSGPHGPDVNIYIYRCNAPDLSNTLIINSLHHQSTNSYTENSYIPVVPPKITLSPPPDSVPSLDREFLRNIHLYPVLSNSFTSQTIALPNFRSGLPYALARFTVKIRTARWIPWTEWS